ncbi:MAG: hypothetical protein U0930_09680 [Pirellulales bacterium]
MSCTSMCQNTTMPERSASGERDKQWTINDILRRSAQPTYKSTALHVTRSKPKALRCVPCRQPEAGSKRGTIAKGAAKFTTCLKRAAPGIVRAAGADKVAAIIDQQQARLAALRSLHAHLYSTFQVAKLHKVAS